MYKVDKMFVSSIVCRKRFKIPLKTATQKQLKELYEIGIKGISKVEKQSKGV